MDMIRIQKTITLHRDVFSIGGALITMILFVFGSILALATAVVLVPIVFGALLVAGHGFRVQRWAMNRRDPSVIDAKYEVIE